MKTKNCTSIEQSKKLIELSLDVNTADMYYVAYDGNTYLTSMDKEYDKRTDTPAWSLSALIDMVPEGTLLSICKHEGKYWFISNEPSEFHYPPIRRHECYDNMIELILNEFIYPRFENRKSE